MRLAPVFYLFRPAVSRAFALICRFAYCGYAFDSAAAVQDGGTLADAGFRFFL